LTWTRDGYTILDLEGNQGYLIQERTLMDNTLKDLELRLERIEQAIETLPKQAGSALTEEDITAYHRVRSVLWDDGTCGINETSPCVISCRIIDKTCRVVPIFKSCDRECSCGPCNVFTDLGVLRGGTYRFGNLGR
jgi:hypothetical protein